MAVGCFWRGCCLVCLSGQSHFYIMILCKPAKLDRYYSISIEALFGSRVSDWLWHHCYIISFILNSRFGQRYWLRELFALVAKTLAHQSAYPRPPCSKAAILFYPPAVPCRQFPAHSIRFKGCPFSRVLYDCTSRSQICDSQALRLSAFKTHACLRYVGAVLDG